jgi:hypothetical protein
MCFQVLKMLTSNAELPKLGPGRVAPVLPLLSKHHDTAAETVAHCCSLANHDSFSYISYISCDVEWICKACKEEEEEEEEEEEDFR